MYRKLLALASATLLALVVAVPASAGTQAPTTSGGSCPSIADGLGGYGTVGTDGVVDFTMVLSGAACKNSTYTLGFYAQDASGHFLSLSPVFTQTWIGDGKTTSYEAVNNFGANYPAQLCVYGTVYQNRKLTHYAPANNTVGCIVLQINSAGGSGFRG